MTERPDHEIVPIGEKPPKPPRISKRVREAIALHSSGECKTWKAAAARAGISREYLSRQLAKDHVKKALRDLTTRTLVQALPRAAERVVELMDCDSDKVSLEAASRLLAIDGIKPPAAPGHSVNVNIDNSPAYLIDLSPCDLCGGKYVVGHGLPPHVCAPRPAIDRRDAVDVEIVPPSPTEPAARPVRAQDQLGALLPGSHVHRIVGP